MAQPQMVLNGMFSSSFDEAMISELLPHADKTAQGGPTSCCGCLRDRGSVTARDGSAVALASRGSCCRRCSSTAAASFVAPTKVGTNAKPVTGLSKEAARGTGKLGSWASETRALSSCRGQSRRWSDVPILLVFQATTSFSNARTSGRIT